jgi:sugar (pentulose or hexulose) kinase
MCEILASVLDRPLHRLISAEGPALGAAVTALAALESYRREQKGIAEPFRVADAVSVMVKFRDVVQPVPAWRAAYDRGLEAFEKRLRMS